MATLFKLYVASMFLLHGLSPLPVMAFGFMVATLAFLVALAGHQRLVYGLSFRLDDRWFGAIFLLGLVALLAGPGDIGLQNLIHCALWLSAWVVSFWWVREWLLGSGLRFEQVSAAAALGVCMLSLAVLAEFTLVNTTGKYLSDLVYFSIDTFPAATVFDDALVRPRAFASEAGFTSIVFECLTPIALLWMRQARHRLLLLPLLIVPAYLVLFSAASISCLALAVIVSGSLTWGTRRTMIVASGVVTGLALLVLLSDVVGFVLYEVILRKYLEFSPDDIAVHEQSFSRPEAYSLAFDLLLAYPLGIGWGAVSQHLASNIPLLGTPLKGSGLISFPLEIGASAGIAGLVAYLAIVVTKLKRLRRLRSPAGNLVFFALLWVSLHHAVVLEAWFPMLWFCLALADAMVVWSAAAPMAASRLVPRQQSAPACHLTAPCPNT